MRMLKSCKTINLKDILMKLKDIKKYTSPFYLTHFYQINSRSIGSGAFFQREKVFYNRVAKAANSSTLLYLFQFLRNQVLSNHEAKSTVTNAWDLSLSESREFNQYYKFTVVRNPYHRLLSAFIDKVASGDVARFSHIPGYKSLAPEAFEQFVQWLSNENNVNYNHHWAPQESLMMISPEGFNRIGKLESYSQDLSSIFDDLGVLYDNQELFNKIFPTIAKPNFRSAEMARNFYSEKSLKTVYRLFEKDFDLFKYAKKL
jgi:hypothetical protein